LASRNRSSQKQRLSGKILPIHLALGRLKPQFATSTERQQTSGRRLGFGTSIKGQIFSINIDNPHARLAITGDISPCDSAASPHIHKTKFRQNLAIKHQAGLVTKRPHRYAISFKHERFRLPRNIAGISQSVKYASRRLKCMAIAACKNNKCQAGEKELEPHTVHAHRHLPTSPPARYSMQARSWVVSSAAYLTVFHAVKPKEQLPM